MIARSQHEFTKEKTWQTNLIPVRIREKVAGLRHPWLLFMSLWQRQEWLNKEEWLIQGHVLSDQQGNLLTCIPDWKTKISKLGRIAWKFPPPHASLQTAKPDIVANKREKEKKFKIRWVRRGTKDNIWYSQHKESYRLQTQLKNLWTNWEGDIL